MLDWSVLEDTVVSDAYWRLLCLVNCHSGICELYRHTIIIHFPSFQLLHTTTMGLETTTNPPTTVSREEHTTLTSSTPQSFGDIPPILRFEDNVEITLSQGEGSSPVSIEGRTGGKLWVTEQYVPFYHSFLTQGGSSWNREVVFIPSIGTGFKLNYQSLTLHALTPASAELEAHLYCQIDDSPASPVGGGDEDEYGEMRELRVFIQDDKCMSPFLSLPSVVVAIQDGMDQTLKPDIRGTDEQYHPSLKLYQIVQHYTIPYSHQAKHHLSHSSPETTTTKITKMKMKKWTERQMVKEEKQEG
jgi:nucleotide-sensitive chloride channel 1A